MSKIWHGQKCGEEANETSVHAASAKAGKVEWPASWEKKKNYIQNANTQYIIVLGGNVGFSTLQVPKPERLSDQPAEEEKYIQNESTQYIVVFIKKKCVFWQIDRKTMYLKRA